MKSLLLTFIIIIISLTSNSNAIIKCDSNDNCGKNMACVMPRVQRTCMDMPTDSACAACKSNSSVSDIKINGLYYNINCLEQTPLPSAKGYCKGNSLAQGVCYANKLAKGSFARYLVLIAVLTLGFNLLMTGKLNPNVLFSIMLAIGLIFGGLQIIKIITGMNTQICNNLS